MAPLKNLFGNGSKDREVAEEVRAALDEMRKERERFATLIEKSGAAVERLETLGEPVAKAAADADAAMSRIEECEQRLVAVSVLASQIQEIDERGQLLARTQEEAQNRLSTVADDSQRIREVFEELSAKVDLAGDLKERLEAFLEIEKPFQIVRDDVAELRGQLESTSGQLGRMREQNERLTDAQKLALQKMEALDRRREEFSRDLQDKERRVLSVEQAVRGMDGVRSTVDDVKRELNTLKSMTDSLAQKTSTLEAQREAVERALSQAEALEQAMRKLDAGVQHQKENARSLNAMQEDVNALRAAHEVAIERSNEVTSLLRQTDEQVGGMRHELGAARDEARNSVERFDFESKGLEAVSQRVADLRAALTEFESRYHGLRESSQTVSELNAQTRGLMSQVEALVADAGRIDAEVRNLHVMRAGLEASRRIAEELGAKVGRIEEARPAVDVVLRDLKELSSTQVMVRDTLEQAQVAHREIGRMRENQSEVRNWLIDTEQSLREMKHRVDVLREMGPALERAEQQTQRVNEGLSSIESRREFVDELHRRLTEAGALGVEVDERGQELLSRMEAAEQRFVSLNGQSQDAERIAGTIAGVVAGVQETVRKVDELGAQVASFEARCESVESIAERTRALGEEIDQRHKSLEDAAQKLQRASKLRQEAAAAAQELGELSAQLVEAVASADARASEVGELSTALEARVGDLGRVDHRLGRFEERLARWESVDEDVKRSLEQIVARQDTVKTLRTDLDRMFSMAEKTSAEVRAITSAHHQVEESRALLDEVMTRFKAIDNVETSLDQRQRQLNKAEERLARSEGLLVEVRSGLEAVQGQKAIVDQAVEKAGTLKFLLKQAEAMIEGLRDERSMTADVREAVALADEDDEDAMEDADDVEARAA
jgi:DNA repair exonuclease SbcCD ATPase subunit